ncbi:hypothetical protein D3C80_1758250 [compost metagenome]
MANGRSRATGPNGSSDIARALSGTSRSTVGSKKLPLPGRVLPPVLTLAPWAMASFTKASMAVTLRSSTIGPMVTPSSNPLPSLMSRTAAVNFSTKAS